MKAFLRRAVALFMLTAMAVSLIACDIDITLDRPDKIDSKPSGYEELKPTETQKPADENDDRYFDCCGGWISKTDWEKFDFEGEELKVLVRNDAKAMREWGKEEVGDDELDLAIRNRNQEVSDTLNLSVKLVPVSYSSYSELQTKMSEMVSGDVNNKLHEYDIVAHHSSMANMPALRNCQANLLDEEIFPYFDFSIVCWNRSIVEKSAVNGRLYSVVGDLNTSLFNNTVGVWHNVDLYERIATEDDPKNLQDFMLQGKWTYAELYRWSSYHNAEEASDFCKHIYGTYIPETSYDVMPYAFDLSFVDTLLSGAHSFNFVDNEKAETALSQWRALCEGEGNGYASEGECSCDLGKDSHFIDGKALFAVDVLYKNAEHNMAVREMNDRYALLTMPKYDEGQERYATTALEGFTLTSVIDHSTSSVPTKGEAVSAYLQCANEYSYVHVRGYYFEYVIKPVFRGQDDLDGLMTKNVTVFVHLVEGIQLDICNVYGPMLNDCSQIWRTALGTEKTLEEVYGENAEQYEGALFDFDKWFGLVAPYGQEEAS